MCTFKHMRTTLNIDEKILDKASKLTGVKEKTALEALPSTHVKFDPKLFRNAVKELEKSLEHIKTLQGILPICMHCHKIRSDNETRPKTARTPKIIVLQPSAIYKKKKRIVRYTPDCFSSIQPPRGPFNFA